MNTDVLQLIQPGPFWDWRVALDLFLGGAGVGAFLMAVYVDETMKGRYRRLCHTAALLAPILIGAGLLLIMSKMGRPLMLFLTYTDVNLTSPLWWGGVFQPILLVGSIVYFLKWESFQKGDSNRIMLGRVLAPVAVVVGVYHGMLLSVFVARPLWNTGPTVVASLLAFCSTGIAAVMLIHLYRMKRAGRLQDSEHVSKFLNNMVPIRNILFAVLLLQLGTYFLWWLSLSLGSLSDQQALRAASEAYGTVFWWIGIGLGVILPILLGAYAVAKGESRRPRMRIAVISLTSVLILVGGFFFRLLMVLGGQVPTPVSSLF